MFPYLVSQSLEAIVPEWTITNNFVQVYGNTNFQILGSGGARKTTNPLRRACSGSSAQSQTAQCQLIARKIYARVGPVDTQRLIAFDNGTCLSFGPDVSPDSFNSSLAIETPTQLNNSECFCKEVGEPLPSLSVQKGKQRTY